MIWLILLTTELRKFLTTNIKLGLISCERPRSMNGVFLFPEDELELGTGVDRKNLICISITWVDVPRGTLGVGITLHFKFVES